MAPVLCVMSRNTCDKEKSTMLASYQRFIAGYVISQISSRSFLLLLGSNRLYPPGMEVKTLLSLVQCFTSTFNLHDVMNTRRAPPAVQRFSRLEPVVQALLWHSGPEIIHKTTVSFRTLLTVHQSHVTRPLLESGHARLVATNQNTPLYTYVQCLQYGYITREVHNVHDLYTHNKQKINR